MRPRSLLFHLRLLCLLLRILAAVGLNWNWRGMHQKLGATAGGLCFGFSVTGIAEAEMPIERNINYSETSTSSTYGKKGSTRTVLLSAFQPSRRWKMIIPLCGPWCMLSGQGKHLMKFFREKLADELRSMLTGLLRAISIHTFLRLGSHMCGGGEPGMFMASHVFSTGHNFRDSGDHTPLYISACEEHAVVVQLVLERGMESWPSWFFYLRLTVAAMHATFIYGWFGFLMYQFVR